MSFDFTRGMGGLLGELGRQQDAAAVRQQELEDKRLEELRENRRIEAQLAKQQALAKYEYDLNQSGSVVGVDSNGLPVTRGDMGSGAKAMSKEAYERTLGMTEEQRAEHDAKMGLLGVQLENAKAAGSRAKAGGGGRGRLVMNENGEWQYVEPDESVPGFIKETVKENDDGTFSVYDPATGTARTVYGDREARAIARNQAEKESEKEGEAWTKMEWDEEKKKARADEIYQELMRNSQRPQRQKPSTSSSGISVESGDPVFDALINKESSGNPNATSPKGAKGLGQLMDGTARDLNVSDPYDPKQNVTGAYKYYTQLVKKYNGDKRLAVAAYNAGPGAVDEWIKNGSDPSKLPEETRNHLSKVFGSVENGEGLLAGGQQQGQPPQKEKPEKKQIDLSQFDLAKQQKKGPVQMDEPARVDIGVPTADAKQQTDDPLLEQLGRGARVMVDSTKTGARVVADSAKTGANAVGGGLLAARDFGKSFGTGERWAKIFAGLSSGAKVTWQKMKESGIPEEQIVEAAAKNSMTVEEYLAQFAKGYSSTKGNGKS